MEGGGRGEKEGRMERMYSRGSSIWITQKENYAMDSCSE